MNSSTWRCRAVRSVMFVPSRVGSNRSLWLSAFWRLGRTRTPSEAPTGTVTRSGVRGKHLFAFRLDGNTRSWLDANRRSAHRVDLPGWAEPRRGAVPLPGAVVRGNCHTPVVRYGETTGGEEEQGRRRNQEEGGASDGRRLDHPEDRHRTRRDASGPTGRTPLRRPARAPTLGRHLLAPARCRRRGGPGGAGHGGEGGCRAPGLTPRSPRAPPGRLAVRRAARRLAVVDRGSARAGERPASR